MKTCEWVSNVSLLNCKLNQKLLKQVSVLRCNALNSWQLISFIYSLLFIAEVIKTTYYFFRSGTDRPVCTCPTGYRGDPLIRCSRGKLWNICFGEKQHTMYNQAITQNVEYFDMSKDMYCKEDLFIPLLSQWNTQILHLTVILIHVSPPLLYTSLAIVIIFIS